LSRSINVLILHWGFFSVIIHWGSQMIWFSTSACFLVRSKYLFGILVGKKWKTLPIWNKFQIYNIVILQCCGAIHIIHNECFVIGSYVFFLFHVVQDFRFWAERCMDLTFFFVSFIKCWGKKCSSECYYSYCLVIWMTCSFFVHYLGIVCIINSAEYHLNTITIQSLHRTRQYEQNRGHKVVQDTYTCDGKLLESLPSNRAPRTKTV